MMKNVTGFDCYLKVTTTLYAFQTATYCSKSTFCRKFVILQILLKQKPNKTITVYSQIELLNYDAPKWYLFNLAERCCRVCNLKGKIYYACAPPCSHLFAVHCCVFVQSMSLVFVFRTSSALSLIIRALHCLFASFPVHLSIVVNIQNVANK